MIVLKWSVCFFELDRWLLGEVSWSIWIWEARIRFPIGYQSVDAEHARSWSRWNGAIHDDPWEIQCRAYRAQRFLAKQSELRLLGSCLCRCEFLLRWGTPLHFSRASHTNGQRVPTCKLKRIHWRILRELLPRAWPVNRIPPLLLLDRYPIRVSEIQGIRR